VIAISPNGQFLYASNAAASGISPFSIGAGGALSPIPCVGSSCETGSFPQAVAATPDGRFLYASNFSSSTVSSFSIGAGGALSTISCVSCGGLKNPDFQSLAISPDQAPTAAFTSTSGVAGSASVFNGSASTASPEQSVARYDWSFGDGTSAQNAGPTPSHTYSTPGTYTVSLTVTDDAGCSTQVIFTGQTASCNGSSAAQATQTITVPPSLIVSISLPAPSMPAPSISGLSETANRWREGNAVAQITRRRKKRPPVGTTFSFTFNEAASVTFTFTEPAKGRKVGKKCVAQTKKNERKHRRCSRIVVAGMLTFSAHAGMNKVRFEGRVSKHKKLGLGSYTLQVSATNAAGERSTAHRRPTFMIVK
jgi:hypothetical protein